MAMMECFLGFKKPIKIKIVAPKGIKRYKLKVTIQDDLILYEKKIWYWINPSL